jgi:hypothetical protein
VYQKELYNGIPMVRKRLHLKAYKLSIVQGVTQWILCTPLIVNVFVTLATSYTIVKLFLKHPALPLEIALKHNYPWSNSVCFYTV